MKREVQIPLDLGFVPALGREDFLLAPGNAEAVAWIERWPAWPAAALAIHGPAGCGKTHLAHVFAAAAGAPLVVAADLREDAPPRLLAGAAAVVIEDADRGVDEESLLHLYNMARETGHHLLLTGRSAPAHWRMELPDLRSRLVSVPAIAIRPPDDALMASVLVKLFADRRLKVGREAIAYLVMRLERSFAAAREAVAAIDARALAEQRDLTVPLLREVLESLSLQSE